MIFTELEKRFDELTPDWIMSTGRLLNTFGDKSKFSFVVNFKGKTVRKASVSSVNGVKTWRQFETKCGIPDFVVMDVGSFSSMSNSMERCSRGLEYENPFRCGCKTGWYIELMGSYFHSGKYVQGISKEEHEKEVRNAYAGGDSHVLILWEDDVWERWDEVCLPLVREFIKKASAEIHTPEWSSCLDIAPADENICWSLSDASHWRTLRPSAKNAVVSGLCSLYSSVDFPYPDKHIASHDFHLFVNWASKPNLRKPSRYGMQCCRHYSRSIAHAKVKGKPSLYEVWHDKETMEKSIRWQLENCDGSHNAKRFLNAMTHGIGFKVVANMRPSKAVLWMKEYGKANGLWLDLCAGWGSRMLAAHALGMEYIGIDANESLVKELRHMASELGISATVFHGDSSNVDFVRETLGGRMADCSFTSPPFFDTEWYSADKEQSISKYPNREEWHSKFLGELIRNAVRFTSDDGVVLFNIGMNERLDMTGFDFQTDFSCDDVVIPVAIGGRSHSERLLRIVRSGDGNSMSVCRICGRLFSDLGIHLRGAHNISSEAYKMENKGAVVSRTGRNRPSGIIYQRRTIYRCPDGGIVKKKDAWIRAWNTASPPADSVLDAGSVDLDPWNGKHDGIDFVTCSICGYRGKNITRHVRREHSIDDYSGPLSSESHKVALKNGARKAWDKRGRKHRKDRTHNKTHKVNGLNEVTLHKLYVNDGLSDAKIGKRYGMTGEGVAYRRKKWGITTRMKRSSLRGAEV